VNGGGGEEAMSYDYADSVLDQQIINLLSVEYHQMREALKFYADENNYLPHEFYPDSSPVDIDSGKIARAALEPKR
jgi:hypothetical protein